MLQWLYTYVANFCSQCFIYFLDVCCKCVYLDVAYVFTHMLQVFYLDVAYVLQWFSSVFQVFLRVLQTYVSSVSSAFRRMFQLLHLDVSKVDRGLPHGIRVGSGWQRGRRPRRRGQRPGRHGPASRALAHKPDALGITRSLNGYRPSLAS